jgi:hypothetical protein
MNRKQKFIEAVQLMAPKNNFIFQTAQLVPEEDLPPIVGVAAFELAATLETLQKSWRFRIPIGSGSREGRERRAPRRSAIGR